jgi:adenylate cyclase
MKFYRKITSGISFIQRYQYRWVLVIAISWTVLDILYWLYSIHSPRTRTYLDAYDQLSLGAFVLRACIVLVMSAVMGFVLIFWLRQAFRDLPLLVNILAKTFVLFIACIIMNFLLHFSWDVAGRDMSASMALKRFFTESGSFGWLAEHSLGWVCLFLLTQIAIEFYEKYSPGVFWDILIGRYIQPKSEERIVMFLDLVDSTAIAEQLDSKRYFSFIRDFIYWMSIAMLEYNGRIYQYVGDEIVVSWLKKPRNVDKCLKALQLATRLLRKSNGYFMRRYGFVPEFKAGIHVGQVTMGEIGIIKKDIAISGDTMNTAARIRTACTELNCKCLVSKDVLEGLILGWDKEYLGAVELRGKTESIELYCLKI